MRFCLLVLWVTICFCEEFRENLEIEPLNDEKMLTQFSFTFSKSTSPSHHHRVYPRVIAEITDKFDLAELELTVTRMGEEGIEWNRKMSAPPGAFLAATFGANSHKSVEERWSSLVGVLAGLFCVSLNQLNLESSISPRWPIPGMAAVGENLSRRRVGFLPREVSCTENLTPWKKILPAGKGFGLVHYLSNAHHQLRHSSYWSLSLHFQRQNANSLSLKHTAVVDVRQVTNGELKLVEQMLKGTGDSRTTPIPITGQILFGVSGYKKTPLARSSTLTLSRHPATNVKISQTTFDKIKMTPQVNQSDLTELWKMELSDDFSIRMAWNYEAPAKTRQNFIRVSRFNGGSGQGQGKIISRIENNFAEEKSVVTLEVIPWWIIPKVSKMKIKNCELSQKLYTPAADKERKTASLLMNLKLAPDSECIVEFEYSTAWPKWTEYPPDANHGRYLPSVIAFYEDMGEIRRTFSGSLLIYVPIPDFSMPYNVLCLVCTVIAMGIGAVHNLTTSQLVSTSSPKADTNIGKVVAFVISVLKSIRDKLKSSKSTSKEPTKPEEVPCVEKEPEKTGDAN